MAFKGAIEKHIVTKGDYAMVPAGQRLFDCPNCKAGKGGPIFFNVAPGQLVAFTISTTTLQPVTVDHTDLATVTGDLYIGVGVDTNGDGAADDVRLLAGEKFSKCLVDETSVAKPVCGQPQVLATYLDCVKCWEHYTVHFSLSDNRTRSFGKFNADQEEFTATIAPDCSSCDDCPQEANCEEVICKLVDALNGEFDDLISGITEGYPDRKGFYPDRVFRAVRLHDNYHVYCFNPIAADCDCEGCQVTDAVVSADINDQTYTFSGNLNPSNNAQTFLGQLKNIAQQIECEHEEQFGKHTGFAFVSGGGPDSCCAYQLHVVTCDDNFVLTGDSGPIAACDSVDPYPGFANTATCVDCGDAPLADTIPTCGLAVIIEQPEVNCNCYVDKPLAYYGRTGELTFIKDLDSYSPIVKATELLAPRLPENFGSWIQWLEYQQETGGRGREYRDVNSRQGWLGLPDAVSRANNGPIHANCHKSYCTWYFGHNSERKPSLTLSRAFNKLQSYVHIPSDDLNTVNSWEDFYEVLINEVNDEQHCNVLSFVKCLQVVGTPTYAPTYAPSYSTPSYTPNYTPNYSPTYIPIYAPVYTPVYTPNYVQTYTPTYAPNYAHTYVPTYTPVYTPIYTPT